MDYYNEKNCEDEVKHRFSEEVPSLVISNRYVADALLHFTQSGVDTTGLAPEGEEEFILAILSKNKLLDKKAIIAKIEEAVLSEPLNVFAREEINRTFEWLSEEVRELKGDDLVSVVWNGD